MFRGVSWLRWVALLALLALVVVVVIGVVMVWVAHPSTDVAFLRREAVVVAVQDHFADRGVRVEDSDSGWLVKPSPAAVSLFVPLGAGGSGEVADFVRHVALADEWVVLDTCSDDFLFCAVKRSGSGVSAALTLREGAPDAAPSGERFVTVDLFMN